MDAEAKTKNIIFNGLRSHRFRLGPERETCVTTRFLSDNNSWSCSWFSCRNSSFSCFVVRSSNAIRSNCRARLSLSLLISATIQRSSAIFWSLSSSLFDASLGFGRRLQPCNNVCEASFSSLLFLEQRVNTDLSFPGKSPDRRKRSNKTFLSTKSQQNFVCTAQPSSVCCIPNSRCLFVSPSMLIRSCHGFFG